MELVRSDKLCPACLKGGHWIRKCRAAKKCGVVNCKSSHHQMLHGGAWRSPAKASETKVEKTEETPFVAASFGGETDTLLQVVQAQHHGLVS